MKEGNKFKIFWDYYNYSILTCTYVEGFAEARIAFLCDENREFFYKYKIKTQKLYKYNQAYSSWDCCSAEISAYTEEDIWTQRTTVNFVGD